MKRRAVLLFILLCSTAEAQDPPINTILEGQYDVGFSDYADLTAFVSIGNGKPYAAMGSQSSGIVHFVDLSTMLPIGGVNADFDLGGPFAAEDVAVLTKPQTGRQFLMVGLDNSSDLDDVAIYDIRDPFIPILVTSVQANINQTHNLFVHTINDGTEERDYLFVCNNIGATISVYDLTGLDPDNPPVTPFSQEKWSILLSASSCAGCGSGDEQQDDPGGGLAGGVHDMTAQTHDNYLQLGLKKEVLYVAADDGVWVYDITSMATAAPTCMGMVDGTTIQSVSASQDGQVVVATESKRTAFSAGNGGMKIYSQQDRSGCRVNLVLMNEVLGPTGDGRAYSAANAVVTDDGFGNLRVYASWTQAGLQVYDINPITGAAMVVAEYDTSGSTTLTSFGGNWGVHTLSDPSDPIAVLLSDEDNGMFAVGLDCDNDLVNDATAIATAPSLDCPGAIGNGIPDTCESDCQNRGLGNGVADSCDIALGTSMDITGNGIPDECEANCNNNSFVDSYDIVIGISLDCDANGIPDECEDCDDDGIADACEIRDGLSPDCNVNGIPDDCDLRNGTSTDINFSLVPDECETFEVIHVDDDAPGDPGAGDPTISNPAEDGSLARPYDEIQEALDQTSAGDVIALLDGTYSGPGNHNILFPGHNVAVVGINGPSTVIIDCQMSGRGFEFSGGAFVDNQARIHGVTIKNGKAPQGPFVGVLSDGGGILVDTGHTPTISNCVITDCVGNKGGGIWSGSPLSSVRKAVVKNSVIINNTAEADGGGICAAAIAVQGCTIVGNHAALDGGGFTQVASSVRSQIDNSIIWANTADGSDPHISGLPFVFYSNIEDSIPGINNISKDPLFLDLASGDFRLNYLSPCIDAGDPSFEPAINDAFDIFGQARIARNRIDMGAQEVPGLLIESLPDAQ